MARSLPKPLSHQKVSFHAYHSISSLLISAYCCTLILIGFVASSDEYIHWFIIPILFCGIVIGGDVVDWLRGRLDIFDPIGVLGLFAFHFFFIAPLLHIYWGYWLLYIIPPEDWREWLGWMGILNGFGLIVYRLSRKISSKHKRSNQIVWGVNKPLFFVVGLIVLIVTAVLQVQVYASYGGIEGYIRVSTEAGISDPAMEGMGSTFLISESFPIVALMTFAVYAREKSFGKSWVVLTLLLLVYFILKMFFGGLRGSRSNTIWGLFWAVGIIHFWIRPISKKVIVVGCIFLMIFMYFYGFYKNAGLDGLRAIESADDRAALERITDRTLPSLLLGDLGRSDVQAFVLYRLIKPDSDYEYALGRTYLAAFSVLVPRSIIDRSPSKVKEGTEALFGRGSYIPGVWTASQVYGIAGEMMLNYGPFFMPLSFIVFGIAVGRVKHLMITLNNSDIRWLLFPFLVNICFIILVGDLENVIFDTIKNITIPLLIILLCLKKSALKRSHAAYEPHCLT